MPVPLSRLRRDPVLWFSLSCFASLGWLLVALVGLRNPDALFLESGPIERLSSLFVMAAAILLAGRLARDGAWGNWHRPLLILAAGLRELDWDKAFTDSGILSLRLYSGDAPLGQKVVAGLIVLGLVWAALRLLRRDVVPWARDLRAGRLGALLLVAVLALYAVAKMLDGLGRKLLTVGIEIDVWTNTMATRSEEAMELIAAIFLFQVVVLVVTQTPEGRRARAGCRARAMESMP